ncbi:NADAR family protein [Streptomyces sp. NPDC004296]|uniref:NADAR family protein n=1 Tax=Streptomyces sp. NPDC004296 TaxID=3364697 RepID=UPI0036CBBA7D
MDWRGPTYRTVDGERIDGAWCHVWWRNHHDDQYFLDDLVVFADGLISGRERTDLAGLEGLLASGRLSPTDPGMPDPPPPPSKWRSRSGGPLTPEGFLLDVADKVAELGGRPTAAQRCWEAIRCFQQDPSAAHRALLRRAYVAIPPHQRIYVLGDMDLQDRPLRILVTDVGDAVDGDGPVVTEQMHREALEYFDRTDAAVACEAEHRAVHHADDPTEPVPATAFTSYETVYPKGWPDTLGPYVLRNAYPAPVVFGGRTYPSVLHAYWALSAADPADHDRIRDAEEGRAAQELGGRVARRADWHRMRVAVMGALLEAKFTQHPELAEVLLATGDSVIGYTGFTDSPFWRDVPDQRGRNWMGRLLELTRAKLAAGPLLPD